MASNTFFSSPAVVASPFENKVRLKWSVVTPPADSGSIFSASVEGYYVYESGSLWWTCPVCNNIYGSNHPATCSVCNFYSGSPTSPGKDWTWDINNYVTRSFVTGTEYTALDQVGTQNKFYVATYGSYCDGVPGKFWLKETGWSVPTVTYASNTGSVVSPSQGQLSVLSTARMVKGESDYLTYSDATSLHNLTYNPDLNKFSKTLPGYNVKAYQDRVQTGAQLFDVGGHNNDSWYISGSTGYNGSTLKSASLESFRGYTNAYEYGCKGSTFYFPWGKIVFSTGTLHPHKGIVSGSTVSSSFTMYLYGTYAGQFTDVTIGNYYYRRLQDGVPVKNPDSTYQTYNLTTDSNLAYPGIVVINGQSDWIVWYRDNISLLDRNLWEAGFRSVLSTRLTGMDDLYSSILLGGKIYPVIFYDPKTTPGWRSVSVSSMHLLAQHIFTVDDCYLKVASTLI